MKKLYSILFLLTILPSCLLHAKVKQPFALTAEISGGTTVCRGTSSPLATFTGGGGMAPYTFTYTVNGGTNTTITSTGGGDTATLSIPTNAAGVFTYQIVSVTDAANVTQTITGQSAVFNINSTTITGAGSGCIGNAVPLTGMAMPSTNPAIWSSSNPGVATVSNTGVVNALSAGTTIISFDGGNGCIATHTFEVGAVLNANFTFNNNACSEENVVFLSSVSGGISPYTYAWNFGDGQTSAISNPTHKFEAIGCATETFNVTLIVTDASGCSESIQQLVTVKEKPHAALQDPSFNPFSNCDNNPTAGNPMYELTVNNISTDTGCTTGYTINWGDGSPTQTITTQATHTYTQLGSFPLTFTATGANGCVNTVTYNVANQSNPAGSLGTSGNTIGCAPLSVGFLIGAWELNSPGTQYVIDFGDDESVTLQQSDFAGTPPGQAYTVMHQYTRSSCPASGSFSASLTVTNLCNSTTFTAGNLQVRTKPIPAFTVPDTGVCAGTVVQFPNITVAGFGNNCQTGATYVWDYGDPNGANNIVTVTGAASPPTGTHVFSAPGLYTVTLSAENNCGIEVTTRQVCVDGPLTPFFTLNNEVICTGQMVRAEGKTITTVNNAAPACPITFEWTVQNYLLTNCGTGASWGFTNGTNAGSDEPEFIFYESGTYTIRLRATNTCGDYFLTRTVVVKKPAEVTVADIANQCFAPSVTINPVATVTNCGTTTPTYEWSFPGGTPSTFTDAAPSVVYSTTGVKTFTLTVNNECGPSTTVTKTFTIYPELVVNAGADITICPTVGASLLATATGGSGAGYTYSWSPATGLSAANIPNPTVNPTATTTYTLTVTDSNNCTLTDQVTVNVNVITPGTIAASQTVCVGGDPVVFTETVAATATEAITYQWQSSTTGNNTDFTDIPGETNTTFDPPVPTATIYYRRLAISSLNGTECSVPGNIVSVTINNVSASVFDSDEIICEGGNLPAFTAAPAATGTGTLTYVWETSTDNVTFTTAGTSASFDPPALMQTTYYRQVVTSTLNSVACTATSNLITITVVPPPTITTEPLATQTLCAGGSIAPLTIAVTGGTGNPIVYTYQWYSNTINSTTGATAIPTATSATFTPPSTTVGTVYYYAIVTTTGAGCSDTSTVSQVIITPSPTFTTQPVSQELCEGETPAPLTIAYTNGTGTPTYRWYKNTVNDDSTGTEIPGATTATYQPVPLATDPATVYYYAQIEFDSGGCSLITSNVAAITINTPPSITAQAIEICSNDTAFAGFVPTDGGGNIVPTGTQYIWTVTGAAPVGIQNYTSQTALQDSFRPIPALVNTTNAPITVTYTVTPQAGICTGTSFTLSVTVNPKASIANSTTAICSSETFTVTPANGNGNIVSANTLYTWDVPVVSAPGSVTGAEAETTPQTDISQQLVSTAAVPVTVTYTVTPVSTTNGNECPGNSFTVVVTVNPVPLIVNVQQPGICSGESFSVTPANGNGNIVPVGTTYTWNTPVITPAGAITANGGGAPVAQTSPQTSIGQQLFNATSDVAAATYTVTPIANGCTGSTFDIVVTLSPTTTVDAVANQTICAGELTDQVNFTGPVAGTVFNWVNNTPSIGLAASGTGDIPAFAAVNSGTTPITATITITPELNGCMGTPSSFTITINPAPSVSFSQPSQVICSDSTSTAVNLSSTTPSATITWTAVQPVGITGVVTSGTTTIPAQTLVNSTSSPIVVTYVANAATTGVECPGADMTYTITVNPVPFVGSAQETAICSEASPNFIPTDGGTNNIPAGTTFTWTTSPVAGITGNTNQTVVQPALNQALINTTTTTQQVIYTVTPTSGGCTGVPFTVTVTVNPKAVVANGSLMVCNEEAAVFNPTGTIPTGTTYSWNTPLLPVGVSGATFGNDETIINIQLTNSGTTPQQVTYIITPVSPQGNCPGNAFNVVVTVNPSISATYTTSMYNGFEISAAGASDGSIDITPVGGSGNYQYTWTYPDGTTQTTQDLSNLSQQGDYVLVITDANGVCPPFTLTVTINAPLPLEISITDTTDVLCFGAATGVIEVAIDTPSIAPFDYVIKRINANGTTTTVETVNDSNDLNYIFDNLTAGNYRIEVIDANNHVEFLNATINQPSEIVVMVTKTDETCDGLENGTISLAISGGTLPYQNPAVTWDDFATGPTRTGLPGGTYIATITDGNMCTKTVTVVINEAPAFSVNPVVTQISCNGANDGKIALNFVGGVGTIDFEWTDNPAAGATRTGLAPGSYTVIIQDSQPCEIRRTFEIVEPAELIIGANVTQPIDCNNAFSGAIDLIPAGGTPPYTIQWTGSVNSTNEDLVNITSGTYLVTVTDANGCSNNRQFTLARPNPLNVTVSSTVSPNCDNGTVVQINTASATGGVPPYNFTWSTGTTSGVNNQNMTTNENGTVLVTVTDSQGCTANTTFTVETLQLGRPSFTIDSYASGTYNLYSIMDPVQFTNTSTGDYTAVSWDFGDGSVSDEENPQHTYMREGTYVIVQTVTYPYGCVATNRMTIVIEKGYDVMIPNAFTPNGDGVNDTFALQFRGATSVELSVYDTWGSMIYYEKGETIKGWDGNLKGKPAENGNYLYKISVVTFYGIPVNFEGPFVLIK